MNLYDNNKKLIGIINYNKSRCFFARKKGKSFVITTKNFCGVKTIKKINLKTSLHLNVNILCSEGKMKLVAIKEKEIILLAENQSKEIELLSGVYRLRIVGDNASGNCIITKK